MLQENGRDFKNIDDNQDRNTTNTAYESQTESIVDEIIESARLVSPTSSENESSKLILTTALSVNSDFSEAYPSVTTARVPAIFRTTQNFSSSFPVKRFYPSSTMANSWRLRQYSDMQQSQSSPYQDYYSSPGPTSMIMMRDKWRNKSGCYYSCIQQAKGLQTVVSKFDFSTNVQLCEPSKIVSHSIVVNMKLIFFHLLSAMRKNSINL